ncbi:MAG: hypothetical protein IJB99_03080, partial [Clostridia bacterium]|nr:hypothetical protein [Clostridia bacterium]
MLQEMKYIKGELLPMLRERAGKHEKSAGKQLRQWKGEKGVCSLLLSVTDLPEVSRLPVYNNEEKRNAPMSQTPARTENKMGVMPVNRLLISMSLPIMISMLVQALYNIVD